MIKYNQILFLFFLLIMSCKSPKLPLTTSSVNLNEKDSIFMDSEKGVFSFVFVKLDGKKLKLGLDTGATTSVINNISLIGGGKALTPQNHEKNVNVQSATRNFKSIRYNVDNFELNSISLQNYHCLVYNEPKIEFTCAKELNMNHQGLLGLNAFAETEKALELNFEKGFLGLQDPALVNLQGYKKVEATIKNNRVFLTVVIAGQEKKMLFDTGANTFASLLENPFKDGVPNENYKTVSVIAGNGITPTESLLYKNQPMGLGDIFIEKTVFEVDSNYNNNILGFGFIKNFNWVIDFKNEEVYFKKYKEIDSSFFDKLKSVENFALAINNQLMVIYSKSEYTAGTIITKVNGKEVTSNNICEFQKLLIDNKESWEDIQIDF